MKKKGIVLLITLMFILSISGLILKNLDDSNKYIDASNKDTYYVNAMVSADNLKTQLISYLVKNEKNLEDILEDEKIKEGLVLNYGTVQSRIHLESYENVYDINILLEKDDEKHESIQELFLQNSVAGFEEFKTLVRNKIKKYGPFTSFKQIDVLLREFSTQMQSEMVMDIKDYLTFITLNKDNNYVKCRLYTTHNEQISRSEFIIDIKAKNAQGLNIVFQ